MSARHVRKEMFCDLVDFFNVNNDELHMEDFLSRLQIEPFDGATLVKVSVYLPHSYEKNTEEMILNN